jgi:hypothetical protein
MEGKPAPHQAAVAMRLLWLATFVVPLILAGLLLAASTAAAAPGAGAPPSFEEELELESEGEGEGEEEGACAEAREEFEEGELEEAEAEEICAEEREEAKRKASGPGAAPSECLVRSAHARLVAYASNNRVRLTIGYTTYEPTQATVDYGLSGGRGSLHLGTARRHLGHSGVLRLTRTLSDAQMSKVEAARHFTVRLHSPEAPPSCRDLETERLTPSRSSRRLAVWSQKDQ